MMRTLLISLVLAFCAGPVMAQDIDAAGLYRSHCRKCHGVRGTPPKTIQKKMEKIKTFDTVFLSEYSEKQIVEVLTKGGETEDMKSFTDKLSPAEMAAVAKYVRELAAKNSTSRSD